MSRNAGLGLALLIWAGGGNWAVSADKETRDKPGTATRSRITVSTAEEPGNMPPPGTRRSEEPASIVIEWAGTYESVVYMLHIRNTGARTVDLNGYALAAPSCGAEGDDPLTLVRGSFKLEAGQAALIITHPDVPTDDEPRLNYANVYLRAGATLTTDSASSLILIDPAAVRPDTPLGPIEAAASVGECCIPPNASHCCFAHLQPPCDGTGSGCWVLVTKSMCCTTLNACGWHKSDFGGGCVYGCPMNVTWQCCSSVTCP